MPMIPEKKRQDFDKKDLDYKSEVSSDLTFYHSQFEGSVEEGLMGIVVREWMNYEEGGMDLEMIRRGKRKRGACLGGASHWR